MANTKKYVSLDKLGLYDEKIKGVIGTADAATLKSAKDYADSLAVNYDAAGSANSALEAAKAYADGKDAAIQAAQKAADDAAAAAGVADGKAVAAQTDVDNLEAYVGTFTATEGVDTVVKYIDAKTADIASGTEFTELAGRVTQAEKDIDAIEADYLKAADKTELEGKITAEAETARAAEKANADAIAAINNETTGILAQAKAYADGKDEAIQAAQDAADAAQAEIDAFLDAAEIGDAAVDTLKEIQAYITSDGEAADKMTKDIAANAAAIEAVEGRMDTAEGDIDALEGRMDAVEGAVATKVETEAYNAKVKELEDADTEIEGRLDDIEAVLGTGEGSVADQIATAKQEAIDAAAEDATTKADTALEAAKKYADEEDAKIETRVDALETASATHALQADLEALEGRVETAEGEIDTLQSEMDAVEAKAAANETEIAKKADKATTLAGYGVEDAYTKTEVDNAITAAMDKIVEVSAEEINELFA